MFSKIHFCENMRFGHAVRNLKQMVFSVFLFFVFCFLFSASTASAATIFFSPSSGSYSAGSTFSVSVRTNTQGSPVNTAEASISFSTSTLELISVSQGSTFYLPSPGSPSRGSGTAYFGGGLPTPGYNGSSGIIGVMTFRARAEGTATISVTSGKVLLNDGQGTDVLSSTAQARFSIVPPPVGSPEVTSATHPDPAGWYAKNTVELSWSRPAGAHGFSFELDQNPDTIPDNVLDTTITTSKTYEDLKDGVWYFHIKARGQPASSAFGNTVHFRIGIDTTAPSPFEIKLVGQDDLNDVTRTPTIAFEAEDAVSGVARYAIYLNDQLVADSATSPYTFDKLELGAQRIKVVAYDHAGNERTADLPIIVTGPAEVGFFQYYLPIPLYVLIGLTFLLLILLAIVAWLLFYRRKPAAVQDEILAIQSEVDESLEELRRRINTRLLKLTAHSNKELFEQEEQLAGEVTKGIKQTRIKIDKKIGSLRKKVDKHK